MNATLECGNLEIMHRMLVVILNLVKLGGKYREAATENRLIAFAKAYVDSYHAGAKSIDLDFGEQDIRVFNATLMVRTLGYLQELA